MPVTLLQEGLAMLAVTGGPLLAALVLSGVVIGILQAATQVNDPAVGFVPRLLVALTGIWLLGGWMLERLSGFLAGALHAMGGGS